MHGQQGWRDRLRLAWTTRGLPQQAGRLVLVFVVLLTAISLTLTGSLRPRGYDLQVGDVAEHDITAPFDLVDEIATEARRQEAMALVAPVYEIDPSVAADAQARISDVMRSVRSVRDNITLSDEQKLAALRQRTGLDLVDSVWQAVLVASDSTLNTVETTLREIVIHTLSGSKVLNAEQAAVRRVQVEEEISSLSLSLAIRAFATEVAKPLIRPNVVLDEQQTATMRELVASQVPRVTIKRGEIIVAAGDTVTEQQLALLQAGGLLRRHSVWQIIAGSVLLSALFLSALAVYVTRYRKDLWQRGSRLWLLALVFSTGLLLAPVLRGIHPFATPAIVVGMLISLLVDTRLAALAVVAIGALDVLATGGDVASLLVTLSGGLIGVFGVSRAAQRSDIWRAGALAGLAGGLTVVGLALLTLHPWNWDPVWTFLAGPASGIVAIGSLPFFESYFGVLTHIKLLELANPNQPLLRRLLLEASGTYHHSLMVANLAEAAAEAVGGDPILTRVGGYYHDIGKLKRPYFFIDNQAGGENPHDQISPHLSAMIIISHVKDGLELAKEYKLPREITRFIEEHHGTCLVSYFYKKAQEAGEQVAEEEFRYPGPRPQSKETAILMLADGSEAIVRSLREQTPAKVEEAIRRIIADRLADGQLNQADLTLKDLDIIARTFTKALTGAMHKRIEYPGQGEPRKLPAKEAAAAGEPGTSAALAHDEAKEPTADAGDGNGRAAAHPNSARDSAQA